MNALTQSKALIYIAAIFLAGAAAGGAGGYAYGRHSVFGPPRPRDMQQHMRNHLRERLHLTGEQDAKLEPILAETSAKMQQAHREGMERVGAIMHETNQKLMPFLNAEQKTLLEAMEKEHANSRKPKDFNGAPGPSDRPPGPPPSQATPQK